MNATLKDLLIEQWLRKRNSGELKWETKNGDKLPIKNMSDYHLDNAINMLLKQEGQPDLEELKCEYEAYISDLD